MSQVTIAPPLVPLPLVRAATGHSWSRIYHDANQGRLGSVRRIGTRLYTDYTSALAYVERARPAAGGAALNSALQSVPLGEPC